ncbi:hypothetical protein FOXYSP1_18546 [Fusarium oxysporum f. sp. phaseoli]
MFLPIFNLPLYRITRDSSIAKRHNHPLFLAHSDG